MRLKNKYCNNNIFENYKNQYLNEIKIINDKLKNNNINNFCFINDIALLNYNIFIITNKIEILIDIDEVNKIEKLDLPDFIKYKFIFNRCGNNYKCLYYKEPKEITIIKNFINFIDIKYQIMYNVSKGLHDNDYKELGIVEKLILENRLKPSFANLFPNDLKNKYIELWKNIYKNRE